ncbi:MAG TPA: hypothetical protein VGM56_09315 [Byssovorax sp.]|jgi:hypothetical protein
MRISKTLCASLLGLATALVGGEALAQEHWSLLGGDTVRRGNDMIYGELGWPDVGFGWAHGVGDKVDIGLRLGLIYGVEYRTYTDFGVDLKVPIRIQVARTGKVSALIHIDPGVKVYTGGRIDGNALFGPEFPIGVQIGIHITPEFQVDIGMDVNMFLAVTADRAINPVFAIAPLFGPGVEYHVDHSLGIGLNTRFGPSIFADGANCNFGGFNVCGGLGNVDFGFLFQADIMYHF